ncbi:MAG: hypothetical protein E6614_27390, partial [Bradyrhizobium sp.]|nr:hypothetical protein [Bradyrhizobium sp.]
HQGGSFVVGGSGSADQADCIANHKIGGSVKWQGIVIGTIGMSGIVYLMSGVCHQAANRILSAAGAGVLLPSQAYPLIKRSVQSYGVYGLEIDWLPIEASWQFRQATCSAPLQRAPSNVASLNLSGGTYRSSAWMSQMPKSNFDPTPQLIEDLHFLIDQGLEGKQLDERTVLQLAAIQQSLRNDQQTLALQYRIGKIEREDYLRGMKMAIRRADQEGEKLLGPEDYHRIFGDPSTVDQFVDQYCSNARPI